MPLAIRFSRTEQIALIQSAFDAMYPPTEKLPAIVVENFPSLGKLAALRFIEWVQTNPEGVISLPTGKTPEHFIKWVERFLREWNSPEIRTVLEEGGVDPGVFPNMRGLRFVQIDEFYPVSPAQHNSFFYYVNHYYLKGFGLDPDRALLIDCSKIGLASDETLETIWPDSIVDLSLRYERPRSALETRQKRVIERIDEWCLEYENRIRAMGGLGFFLGGIGPDGHIGFNIQGSDHHSTTRLAPINYETQAAAATDLGGIEVARKRRVITIGLGTIVFNPDVTAIILAAGEAKAGVVARAIEEERHVLYPATVLQGLPNTRFYLTPGAARGLVERRLALLRAEPAISEEETERILIDLSVKNRKCLSDLNEEDYRKDPEARLLLEKSEKPPREMNEQAVRSLVDKIGRGIHLRDSKVFLHTEPHHDDLMLGIFPHLVRHMRSPGNTHHFATFTSGFTSVTNRFVLNRLKDLAEFLETDECKELLAEGYFDPENRTNRKRDVWEYLDGVAASWDTLKSRGGARRLLRDLMTIFDERDIGEIRERMEELTHYFHTQYPGKKDPEHIQKLKGMSREWEVECLWGYLGWNCDNVHHLRLGFYTGDLFTEEPTVERDVLPILELLRKVNPDVVSVTLDPEASGPDTHYKALQAVTEALRRFQQETGRSDIEVWGYRNVWQRFHAAEANVFVPVSLNMFSIMNDAFRNAFISQRDASFPSYEHDGPFSELAQIIQVEQYQKIKVCLGREWFHDYSSAFIRAARGLVYLKRLTLEEFYRFSREIRRQASGLDSRE